MHIRSASGDESRGIAAIHEQTARVAYAHIFPDQPFPRAQTIKRWRVFPGQLWVAEDGNALIGFVAFDETELHALYVLPNYQGSGIGSRLLAAAGEVAYLWVLKDNLVARQFYEARSWMADGHARAAFGVVEIRYFRRNHPTLQTASR
jgi:ribosomal protein S18 acetylase RimI-like enzyme